MYLTGNDKAMSDAKKYTYWGIPILFIVGSAFHFLYDLTGQLPIIGAVCPVNESVWEHCKMVVLPIIVWWTLYYDGKGKKDGIDEDKWFTGALVSLLCAVITMPLLYYGYTGAFGIESLPIDILILFIAIAFGQLLGFHVFTYGKGINAKVAFTLMVIVLAIFVIFTFKTPHYPIFLDEATGSYGI